MSTKAFERSLGMRSSLKVRCQDPVINNLSPEELAALHLCKSEINAAIFRLYLRVPQQIADKLLGEYVTLPE